MTMTKHEIINELRKIKKMCSDVIKDYEQAHKETDKALCNLSPVEMYIKSHIDTDSFKSYIPDIPYPRYEDSKHSDDLACVPFNDIYEDFVAFCSSQGIKSQFTKNNFSRLLKTELGQYVPFHLREKVLGRKKRIGKSSTATVYVFRWMPYSGNDDY